MKVTTINVHGKFRDCSFLSSLILMAVCAMLVAPLPLMAAAQKKPKKKRLKEILEEVRLELNPPEKVVDPNETRSSGVMFGWSPPALGAGGSLTLGPETPLGGVSNLFSGSKAFGGADPFKGETPTASGKALGRLGALRPAQGLEKENPFGNSQGLSSGSLLGNNSPFSTKSSSQPFGTSGRFSRSGYRRIAGDGKLNKAFGSNRAFGASRGVNSRRKFGDANSANRFGGTFGTGLSSGLYGNPGLGYKGQAYRSRPLGQSSPSTGASDSQRLHSDPTTPNGN